MYQDLSSVLQLLGSVCASAEAALEKGSVERKDMRCARQLAVQSIINNWEEPKFADDIRNRVKAAIEEADAELSTPDAIFTSLASKARKLRNTGNSVENMLTLEYELISRTEEFYQQQMAKLAASEGEHAPVESKYDAEVFAKFLSEQANGAPVNPTGMRRVPGGFSKLTLILSIESNGVYPENVVVRLDRAGSHLKTSVADEYAVIEKLYENDVLVPQPIAQEPTGELVGDAFIIVAAIPGTTIGDMFNLPEPNRITLRSVATEMARLHQVPLEKMGGVLRSAGTTRDTVEAWLKESKTNWEALGAHSAIIDSAFDWLLSNLNLAEGDPVVMHGDIGLNNILVDKEEVSALLDWEFVQTGHAGYDLGYFHCMAVALGEWDEFLSDYAAAGGKLPDVDVLDFFILLSTIRLSTMVWQAADVFESGKSSEIMWVTPSAHDKRIATMRVAQRLEIIRAREATSA